MFPVTSQAKELFTDMEAATDEVLLTELEGVVWGM